MKKKVFSCIVILCVTVLLLSTACKVKESVEESLVEKIDQVVLKNMQIGGAVGIIHNGVETTRFYGNKSISDTSAPDIDTVFEIGSIGKVFTAILMADLHLKGHINALNPVGDVLPVNQVTMPGYEGKPIGFVHLSNHTSALPELPDNLEQYIDDPLNPLASYKKEYMYEFLNGYKLSYEIGTTPLYSSLAFGLLGHALGIVKGGGYRQVMEQEILPALHMPNTSVLLTQTQRENLAAAHDENGNPVSNWTAMDCFQGAGLIKSSLKDMMTFLKINLGMIDTTLNEAVHMTHQPEEFITMETESSLAWGWDTLPESHESYLWHNGRTGGYRTYIGFHKGLAIGVVVLFNSADFFSADIVGRKIMELLEKEN